jgi:hypothetical protein
MCRPGRHPDLGGDVAGELLDLTRPGPAQNAW